MSTQKGNWTKKGPQKHQNSKAFKNNLHDTSNRTKKINTLEFNGVCERCRNILDWKVKYKKYKMLTTMKKCVKCLEKKVKDAYYIVCLDCCEEHNICSKCSKSCDELTFAETEAEKRRKDEEYKIKLEILNERQRRKFLRLLDKRLVTEDDLVNGNVDLFLFRKRAPRLHSGDGEEGDEDDDDDEFDDLDAQMRACDKKMKDVSLSAKDKEAGSNNKSKNEGATDDDYDGDEGDYNSSYEEEDDDDDDETDNEE